MLCMRSFCRRNMITTSTSRRARRQAVEQFGIAEIPPAPAKCHAVRTGGCPPTPRAARPSRPNGRRASGGCRRRSSTLRPSIVGLVIADGQKVEQALGRMRVVAVARIDHGPRRVRAPPAAPACRCRWWRTTNASASIASSVASVSSSVSPLLVEDSAMSKLTTIAPSRRAASSKLVRVRVDDSKKRLTTVRRSSNARQGAPLRDADLASARDPAALRYACGSGRAGSASGEAAIAVDLRCGHRVEFHRRGHSVGSGRRAFAAKPALENDCRGKAVDRGRILALAVARRRAARRIAARLRRT